MNCANCGRELMERGCKVRCTYCGYFEDCSDPSAPGDWGPPGGDASPAAIDSLAVEPREKPSLPAKPRSEGSGR
jgi:hypothetical protein